MLASTEPEGFGYVNIEGMLAGDPIITTRLGGPLEYIIDGQTGLFIEPNDPISIVEALLRLQNPDLYNTLAINGKSKAQEYSIDRMVEGYLQVISRSDPQPSLRVDPQRTFEAIGEGVNTVVYRKIPSNGYVTQVFKPERNHLTAQGIREEYAYLLEAYAEMPQLIPTQRLILPEGSTSLDKALLVKQEVVSNPERNTLRRVGKDDIEEHTLEQLHTFVAITKALFSYTPQNENLQHLPSRVPDIVDSKFENLIIDIDGNLRLVDTNAIINLSHLKSRKIDLTRDRIAPKVLRRLMYIEAKFFGETEETLKADPFYTKYINAKDFEELFRLSLEANEPIGDAHES